MKVDVVKTLLDTYTDAELLAFAMEQFDGVLGDAMRHDSGEISIAEIALPLGVVNAVKRRMNKEKGDKDISLVI